MRVNTPVTDIEAPFPDGEILVSKTNQKGVITYLNRTFIEISGFSEAELVGKSHNIVRHPDMPSEAFADLWATIQKGEPWTGIVKNRCKNGDFYWVSANVIPVTENGHVVEYMSVRTKPSQEEIRNADTLYKKIRDKKATLEKSTLSRWAGSVAAMKVSTSLYAGASTVMGLFALNLVQADSFSSLAAVSSLAGLVVVPFLARYLVKRVAVPLEAARETLVQMSEGNYFDWIDTSATDEAGQLKRDIKKVQVKLGFDVMDGRTKAAEAQRIQTALDNVGSSVMVADEDFNIIYMNRTVEELFTNIADELRTELPNFDETTLLGSNMDIFHKNPAHQRSMLGHMTSTAKSQISIAGLTLQVVANPVNDENGKRLGTVVEWSNRTEEVAVETEIDNIIAAARTGNLNNQIDVANKTGFFKEVSERINELLDTLKTVTGDIARVIGAMSNGDMRETITREYEGDYQVLATDINTTVAQIENVVTGIRDAAEFVKASSEEISAGNTSLSQRVESQAANLEETSSSMEQLTGTVENNSTNAQEAKRFSEEARTVAERGGEVVTSAVSAMGEIRSSSDKIAEIIGVIDEIAFQTNLLALNASVEAARAGDQGRGFAVVATEVRNLAGRSAEAAKQIKELIEDSREKVRVGGELVNESGEALQEIISGVGQVVDLVNTIASASSEQSIGIAQVNTAVSQMDEITQQNAAMAEETSAASVSMNERAVEMNNMLQFFTLNGGGGSVNTPQAATAKPAVSGSIEPIRTFTPSTATDDDWREF